MSVARAAIICAIVFGLATAASIPKYIHICKKNDPHVSKCIRESIEVLRPHLAKGIPEIGVPGIEPLHIDEIVIANGNGPSHFRAILKKVDVYGVSEFRITKLKADTAKNAFRVGVEIPLLRFVGEYDVDARILVVPIKGSGPFTANATNCEAQGILEADIVKGPDGKRHFKFQDFNLALRIGDYSIHLDNLFAGDAVLSQATNDVLNENKQDFIQASLPFVQRQTSLILKQIADSVTKNLDYDEVFPEN